MDSDEFLSLNISSRVEIVSANSPAEDIAYSSLAVLLAAFYIWGIVRLINRHERWAKRVVIGIPVALALYVLSAAPLNLLIVKLDYPAPLVAIDSVLFDPLEWSLKQKYCPDFVWTCSAAYYEWWRGLIGVSEIRLMTL